jgi:hypothetical protein
MVQNCKLWRFGGEKGLQVYIEDTFAVTKFWRLGSLIYLNQPRPAFPDEEPEEGAEVGLGLCAVDEGGVYLGICAADEGGVYLGLCAADEGGVYLGLFAVDEATTAGALHRPLTGDRLTAG